MGRLSLFSHWQFACHRLIHASALPLVYWKSEGAGFGFSRAFLILLGDFFWCLIYGVFYLFSTGVLSIERDLIFNYDHYLHCYILIWTFALFSAQSYWLWCRWQIKFIYTSTGKFRQFSKGSGNYLDLSSVLRDGDVLESLYHPVCCCSIFICLYSLKLSQVILKDLRMNGLLPQRATRETL